MPVSWTIGTFLNAELINTMLRKAVATLSPDEKPVVHSDKAVITGGLNGLKSWMMSDSQDLCQGKAALRIIPPVKVSSGISEQRCSVGTTGMTIVLMNLPKR